MEDLSSDHLIERKDTKFISHISKLHELLDLLPEDVVILTINELNQFKYSSEYLDTEDLELNLSHHNQRKNRMKVRIRHYVDTNNKFLEIKKKDNRGTTSKIRHYINGHDESEFVDQHIQELSTRLSDQLEKKLFTRFDRITLVNKERTERLTIDRNLEFIANTGVSIEYNNLVVFELKHERNTRHSIFMGAMKKLKIRPKSFSKYCLGISDLYDVKQNRFIQQRREITKIENDA